MSAAHAYPLHAPIARSAANDKDASTAPSSVIPFPRRYAALEPMAGGFAYDSLGNIRSKTMGTRSVAMSYDGRNRLSAANDTGETGNRALSYDTRGNVTWLGGQNFTYNAMNRPTSMGGDVDAVYRYDGHGRRIRTVLYKDEGGYIIRYNVFGAGGDLIFNVQIDQSPSDEDYVTTMVKMDGQSIARVKSEGRPWNYTDTVTYLHNDHLGSAGSGTDETGAVAWREEYSPFGMTMINDTANDNQAGFTGHIKDSDTGLNYMQARYYDPVIGRFLSVDPVGFMSSGGNPGYFNRYAYTMNDPINANDPDGEFLNFVIGAAIGAAIETGSQLIANGGDFSALDGGAILKSGGVGALTGGIGGALAKQGATRAIGGLSNQAKGRLGETIVRGKLALKGQKVIATQTKVSQVPGLQNVTGRGANSVVDFAVKGKNGATKVIDAKFTTTGKVSNTGAQRHLKSQIGDNFSNAVVHADDVATAAGRAGAVVGGAVGGGASAAHNRCQDNGNC